MTTTIIAQRKFTRTLASRNILTATARLHHLSGNARPHFSVTGEERNPRIRRDNGIVACGCLHDDIAKYFPKLRPIIAMHLSDDTGTPMHADANGWYLMAGALGGAMEQYHAGNSNRHMPLMPHEIDQAKPYITTEYCYPTADECLRFWAEHVRVGYADALNYKLDIMRHLGPMADAVVSCGQQWESAFGPIAYKQPFDGDPGANAIKRILKAAFIPCRERHSEIIASFKDRWQAEANAALAFLREGSASND